MGERVLPAALRRSVHDPVVTEDSLSQACVLVGVLSGRYSRALACQAIGCTPTQLLEQIASAGLAGDAIVRVAIEKHFQWQGLWAYHVEQAQARPRPVVVSSPDNHAEESRS
jgi:hypothetical protein